jgi:S-adenosylmethionine decarboxylase
MDLGAEWLIEAAGCRSHALMDVEAMRVLFDRVIHDLDLHPVHDPVWHVFPPPGGMTGFVVLSESHLACHTYPEHGIITVNLYCCRPRAEWPWRDRLAEMFGATHVEVRLIERAVVHELASWR